MLYAPPDESRSKLYMQMNTLNAESSNVLSDDGINDQRHPCDKLRDGPIVVRTSIGGGWRDALVSKHCHLFKDGSGATHGYPAVGDGWRDLLERALDRISAAVGEGQMTILQIKSKYGTLRLYHSSAADLDEAAQYSVEEAVALAKARSACTCEICGDEGGLFEKDDWLATACEQHAVGQPVPVPRRWENVHIVRNFDAGSTRSIACRRYVRETDSFEDVPPLSLDIKE
jgi:hypothetical protein